MDLKNSKWMYLKAGLLVGGGVMSSGIILLEHPSVKVAMLLGVAVWCFARAYYFAFYVIEHYIDPGYRFAGLWHVCRYLLARRARADTHTTADRRRGGSRGR